MLMVLSVIEGGLAKAAAALRFNVTAKTVAKWVERFRAEGRWEFVHVCIQVCIDDASGLSSAKS